MSGHSHWATIRRKKGAADAKRGQLAWVHTHGADVIGGVKQLQDRACIDVAAAALLDIRRSSIAPAG